MKAKANTPKVCFHACVPKARTTRTSLVMLLMMIIMCGAPSKVNAEPEDRFVPSLLVLWYTPCRGVALCVVE
jgi:hypothetical protein